jgi:RsiW-degrading membrane proteinase PrsW (M82 family)
MILFLSSIAPAVLIMLLIYQHDIKKEPLKMLLKAFFGGLLSIIIALGIVQPIDELTRFFSSGLLRSFYDAFCCAAIPEEFAKWINCMFFQSTQNIACEAFVINFLGITNNINCICFHK